MRENNRRVSYDTNTVPTLFFLFWCLVFGVILFFLFFFSLIIYKNAKKFTCLQTPKPESLSCITFSHTEHLTSVEINSNQCEY